MEQYKFNMKVAPDRSSLLLMEKGNKKTVREYALRWREKASHVQPSLLEKEMVTLFVITQFWVIPQNSFFSKNQKIKK